MKRRDFLKASLLGVGGLCLPLPLVFSRSSQERLRIGIIGTGKQFFRRYLEWAEFPDVDVVALSDVEEGRLARAGEEFSRKYRELRGDKAPVVKLHADFRRLLDDKEIDAVVIVVPDHWHAYMSVVALRAGKHVYCEKPLGLSVEECNAVVRAEASSKKIFQMGLQQRSTIRFQKAVTFLQAGGIGEIRKVIIHTGGPGTPCFLPDLPAPKGLDWDMWVGPTRPRGYHPDLAPVDYEGPEANWRLYDEFAGGQLVNFGVHSFDTAHWVLGTASRSGACDVRKADVGGVEGVELAYDKGPVIQHRSGYEDYDMEFYGSDGSLFSSRQGFWIRPSARERDLWKKPLPFPGVVPDTQTYYEIQLGYAAHFRNWVDSIRGLARPFSPAIQAQRATTSALLCAISYRLGSPGLGWTGTEFPYSREANALLSRPIPERWRIS